MDRLFVDQAEEITSVVDRLLKTEALDLDVIVPEGALIIAGIQNLELLRREAQAVGKKVRLVTSDFRGQMLARKAGLELGATADLPPMRPRVSDILPPPVAFKPVPEVPEEEILLTSDHEEGVGRGSRSPALSLPRIRISGLQKLRQLVGKHFILLFSGGTVLVAFFAAASILPRARVELSPRTDTIEADFSFPVSTKKEGQEGVLAGQIIEVALERTKEFSASGSQSSEGRARGTIDVFNEFSSATQTLIETTRFVSEDGKLFRSTKTVVVPGAKIENGNVIPSSILVPVIAAEPGPEYNIGPSSFSIPGFQGTPKYTAFYGRSLAPMLGGAKGIATVVTEEDRTRAEKEVGDLARASLEEDLESKIPPGFVRLKEATQEIVEITSTAEPGEAVERFSSTARASVQSFLFLEEDVLERMNTLLEEKAGAAVDILGMKKITYTVTKLSFEEETLQLKARLSGEMAWKVNADEIRQAIAGKDEEAIRRYLADRKDVEGAKITFWPFWVRTAPDDPGRIAVTVDVGSGS